MHSVEREPSRAAGLLAGAIILLGAIYVTALGVVDQNERCRAGGGELVAAEQARGATRFVEETNVFGSALTCRGNQLAESAPSAEQLR